MGTFGESRLQNMKSIYKVIRKFWKKKETARIDKTSCISATDCKLIPFSTIASKFSSQFILGKTFSGRKLFRLSFNFYATMMSSVLHKLHKTAFWSMLAVINKAYFPRPDSHVLRSPEFESVWASHVPSRA